MSVPSHPDVLQAPDADPRDALFSTHEIMGDLGRRAGNASTLILAMMAAKFVLQLGSLAVLARLVPPAEQGIIAMAMPIMMIAMILSNFGLSQAMVQREDMDHRLASTLFWLNAAFGTACAVLMGLLAYPAAAFYDQPEVAAVFIVLSTTVVLSSIAGQYVAILRRKMRILAVELTNTGGLVVGIVAGILAALFGWGYWAIVVQQVVNTVVMLALLVFTVRWVPSGLGAVRFGDARESLRFGGFLAVANLVKVVADNMPIIFVGRLFGDTSAGLFYRANGLSDMPRTKVLMPLSGAFVPTLSRLQNDEHAFRAMFIRLVNRSNLLLLPVGVLLVAAAEPVTAFMLGPDWSAAVPLLALLGIRIFFVAPQEGLRWCFMAVGVTKPLLVVSLVNLCLVTAALWFGAAQGLVWMTVAYVLVQAAVVMPVLIAFALRETPVRLSTLAEAGLFDLVFATLLTGVIYILCAQLPNMLPVLEILLVGSVIGLAFLLKVAVTPSQRQDVLKVLLQVLSKIIPARRTQ